MQLYISRANIRSLDVTNMFSASKEDLILMSIIT